MITSISLGCGVRELAPPRAASGTPVHAKNRGPAAIPASAGGRIRARLPALLRADFAAEVDQRLHRLGHERRRLADIAKGVRACLGRRCVAWEDLGFDDTGVSAVHHTQARDRAAVELCVADEQLALFG